MVEASRQAGAGTTREASRSWRLWPLWGTALGAETLAHYRRRGRCGYCGRERTGEVHGRRKE
jgi:hypothetical protein